MRRATISPGDEHLGELYTRRRQAGQCLDCGKPVVKGSCAMAEDYCATHRPTPWVERMAFREAQDAHMAALDAKQAERKALDGRYEYERALLAHIGVTP